MRYPAIKEHVVISEQFGIAIDLTTGKNIDLPTGAFPVLKLVDGKTDMDDILREISKTYKVSSDSFNNFFANMSRLGFITFSPFPQKSPHENKPPIRVASIEITEKCNLKCRYCYGAFAPDKSTNLSCEEATRLFKALKERDVKTLELTGGEPTINPDFDKILNEACKQFDMITIMTNAVVLRPSTLQIYQKHRNKVGFSISIDGFSDETNDYQRGVRNTFQRTLNNIIRIKEDVDPHFLRVVYMLTNENINESDHFFEHLLSHGIHNLMVSVPENVEKGRTYKLSDGCMMSDRKSKSRSILGAKVMQLGEKYGKRINTIIDRLGTRGTRVANAIPSCGAGWTMLSFQANGNVQPCNMMGSEWTLGNFKEDSHLNFLSHNNSLYTAFATINLSAENGNRDECQHCEHNDFCGKCINKVFMANKERLAQGKDLCPVILKTRLPKEVFQSKSQNI
ncbi:MAG TPA: hypothetical protein DD401_02920 [Prevotella sp.]|nr:hypothetical protein [Prevotella sp.]